RYLDGRRERLPEVAVDRSVVERAFDRVPARRQRNRCQMFLRHRLSGDDRAGSRYTNRDRSEEHTSELQSLTNLVCRLLLEKRTASARRSEEHTSELQSLPN